MPPSPQRTEVQGVQLQLLFGVAACPSTAVEYYGQAAGKLLAKVSFQTERGLGGSRLCFHLSFLLRMWSEDLIPQATMYEWTR